MSGPPAIEDLDGPPAAPSGGKGPRIANPNVDVVIGVVAMLVAAWAFHDAYESRGTPRPRLVSWLGI